MVIFGSALAIETFKTVVRSIWLSEYGDEPGAREHRVDFRDDNGTGTATGYIAKYISKNIDGEGAIGAAIDHETGHPVRENVVRVDAWASVHRIRQFQQIGGPCVGLWRELRRLREGVADDGIERARIQASVLNSWSGMVREVGGIEAGRCTTVRVWSELLGTLSRYGELQPSVPAGVVRGSVRVRSRHHVWRIVRSTPCTTRNGAAGRNVGRDKKEVDSSVLSPLGPVAITVRTGPGANEPRGWSNPRETSQAGPN
jgi:hypothetical protein